MSEYIEPQLGAEPFSCPHCNTVAHQDWYSLFLKPENATDVVVLTPEAANAIMLVEGEESGGGHRAVARYFARPGWLGANGRRP
jgi:hypothetical protein